MSLVTTRETRVSMVTFGGQQCYPVPTGFTLYFDSIFENNASYLIVKAGLNMYVLESNAVVIQ